MYTGNVKNQTFKEVEYGLVSENENKLKKRKLFIILKRVTFGTLKLSLLCFFLIFVAAPLVFKFSYSLQRNVIFLNFVSWPKNPSFNQPSKYIDGAHNFYLKTDDGIQLGVWQILPTSLLNQTQEFNITYTEAEYFNVLNDGTPVVIYNHGNSGHRAAGHRIELYKVLRKQFHVIAFDYRSYGDSTDVEPSEEAIVRDCIFVFNWVASKTKSNIFVWGHSLGTGLSTHMLAVLSIKNVRPTGLVLESPFNNMRDEISEHPMSTLFKGLPWFYYTVIDPMQQNNFTFESDKFIIKVDCPILIIHAEDDRVVPYKLGYKLYKTAQDFRRKEQGFVQFKGFHAKFGYGHKYLCRAPELEEIIMSFKEAAIEETREKNI